METEIKPDEIVINAWSSKRQGAWNPSVPNGVQIVHLPSGTVVEEDSARSQHKNKAIALDRLRDILSAMRFKFRGTP
jgi:protein subunit release factor A